MTTRSGLGFQASVIHTLLFFGGAKLVGGVLRKGFQGELDAYAFGHVKLGSQLDS